MAELYSQYREKIRTGDMLAWKKTKITSIFDVFLLLYQKICGAEYIHTAIAFRTSDRLFIVEATPPVVRMMPVSLLEDDEFFHFSVEFDRTPAQETLLLENIGKPYNILDFLANLLHVGDPDESYYCSEECAEFYADIGVLKDEEPGITPDVLVHALLTTGKVNEPVHVKIDRGNPNGV